MQGSSMKGLFLLYSLDSRTIPLAMGLMSKLGTNNIPIQTGARRSSVRIRHTGSLFFVLIFFKVFFLLPSFLDVFPTSEQCREHVPHVREQQCFVQVRADCKGL